MAALAVDGEGLLGRAQGAATRTRLGGQDQAVIPGRQIFHIEWDRVFHGQQPVAVVVGMTHALAVFVHHLSTAQILDPHRQLARCRIDHAGAQVERHPGPLQGVDVVGAQTELGSVRLGGDSDADLGGIGERTARPGIAPIRGGDGEVVLSPEVLGRLVVQITVEQAVEIIERPYQGDLVAAHPLHRDGARCPEQGQCAMLDPQHHGHGRTARIHVLDTDPGEGQ
ncbi:hypothetical protein D3C79_570330 [compost metagenome]